MTVSAPFFIVCFIFIHFIYNLFSGAKDKGKIRRLGLFKPDLEENGIKQKEKTENENPSVSALQREASALELYETTM